jgi:hypothetical protein
MAGVGTITTTDGEYVQLAGAREGRRRLLIQNMTAGATVNSFAAIVPAAERPDSSTVGYTLVSVFSPATLTNGIPDLVLETGGAVWGKRTTATNVTFRVIDE